MMVSTSNRLLQPSRTILTIYSTDPAFPTVGTFRLTKLECSLYAKETLTAERSNQLHAQRHSPQALHRRTQAVQHLR